MMPRSRKPIPGSPFFSLLFWLMIPLVVILAQGCSVKSDMMTHLSESILNNNDLDMVESGAPAYLLMVDSLISGDPESEEMLATGAQLYTAYADVFVTDKERSKKLADKAMTYATTAICEANGDACGLRDKPYEKFRAIITDMDEDDLPYLFTLGNAWASWIMANTDDFNALADISRIEAIMHQVIRLDETYKDGAAYLYLGTLATFLPPALGGRPEEGRAYFEKAIVLSQGKNLMTKVIYAKLYAKMIFDRPLHDRLLTEVMETDPDIPGYTLINTYAQKQARQLLDEADDYF
ncbi:MAG: TRAP transporter TatT component family protein [Desulfobacterales bacterium]|nr:TRAP transporter TatT component family protein [Desulfobacterales bacterium]